MNKNLPSARGNLLAAAGIALVFIASASAAQTVSEVTVEAPHLTTRLDSNNPPGGAQTETTTIKVMVSYADLDLAKTSDVEVLHTRIKAAAAHACAQLEKLDPLNADKNCLAKTTVLATTQVEAAITAAGRK